MPLQATSGAASYDAFGGGVPVEPVYIEQIFSTYLYTGTGAAQTITNGIDLSTKGGLVWTKVRSQAYYHYLFDTVRGTGYSLNANDPYQQTYSSNDLTGFTSTGFTLGTDGGWHTNKSGETYASWTFRKQPKFFDVVTYSGNSVNARQISHNLGSTPGCIIVKNITNAADWGVWHTSLTASKELLLNTTDSAYNYGAFESATSTTFTVNDSGYTNQTGSNYVAYLFAHDAGGFGLTGTDNVISCGTFTTDSGGNATVNLGYEPAWLMFKCSSNAGQNWDMLDTMRGWSLSTDLHLEANSPVAEDPGGYGNPTATGFVMGGQGNTQTYIYIAIRRGPMKVPTDGTKVFSPTYTTSSANPLTVTTNFPVDLSLNRATSASPTWAFSRLTGATSNVALLTTSVYLQTQSTAAESSPSKFGDSMQSNTALIDAGFNAGDSTPKIYWNFGRAPGFFDEVCYAGTNTTGPSISHNLGAVPELMIVKNRTTATNNWWVYSASLGNTSRLFLNDTSAVGTGSSAWTSTSPTSSVFTVGTSAGLTNGITSENFVAYLFATCPGVSKVGSYTGNGSTQTIDCGFTGGARFVLIKRTDSTGDWYVWDSARGIVAGNDPHLSLNTTAAEVTTDDSVDTDNTGFVVNQLSATNINVTSASYIFLSVA